jgi:hypothetical protein
MSGPHTPSSHALGSAGSASLADVRRVMRVMPRWRDGLITVGERKASVIGGWSVPGMRGVGF